MKTRTNRTGFLPALLLVAAFVFALPAGAQVTIGSGESPDTDALLDLKETTAGTSSKGLLLPRVALVKTTDPAPLSTHDKGMFVYNTTTSAANGLTPGVYYNDGTKWMEVGSGSGGKNQFYMPSIVLPTDPANLPGANYTTTGSGTATTFTVNLYNLYKEQYQTSSTATSIKSTGAPVLNVYTADQLHYYIVYFDNAVFSNVTISTAGSLSYRLAPGYKISEKTFMNILLCEK
jgi:hypothetical protein